MSSLAEQKANRKSQDGKVFKRITGKLCQTTQDKEITFTNPTLWCQLNKMSFSSAIIEQWADYCSGVISYALSLLTFKVSCLSALSRFWKTFCHCSVVCWVIPLQRWQPKMFCTHLTFAISNSTIKHFLESVEKFPIIPRVSNSDTLSRLSFSSRCRS